MSRHIPLLLILAALVLPTRLLEPVQTGTLAAPPSAGLAPQTRVVSTQTAGVLPPSRYRALVVLEGWLAGD